MNAILDSNFDDITWADLYDGAVLVVSGTGTEFSLGTPSEGRHRYRVVAYDAFGRSGSDSVKVTVTP